LIANEKPPFELKVTEELLEEGVNKFYKSVIAAIDAQDNGIDQFPKMPEQPKYSINSALSRRVSRLVPLWYEKSTNEEMDSRFQKAMELCAEEIYSSGKSMFL